MAQGILLDSSVVIPHLRGHLDLAAQVASNEPLFLPLTALAFKLRAWIDSEEEWMKITSELTLAIHAALAKENIAMG